jgi:hypothetical protein
VVAATVRVVDFSGMESCRAVCHCIAPAVDNMLSPATRAKNTDAPHKHVDEPQAHELNMVCIARSRAIKSTEVLKSLDRLPKGPVTKAMYKYKPSSCFLYLKLFTSYQPTPNSEE